MLGLVSLIGRTHCGAKKSRYCQECRKANLGRNKNETQVEQKKSTQGLFCWKHLGGLTLV